MPGSDPFVWLILAALERRPWAALHNRRGGLKNGLKSLPTVFPQKRDKLKQMEANSSPLGEVSCCLCFSGQAITASSPKGSFLGPRKAQSGGSEVVPHPLTPQKAHLHYTGYLEHSEDETHGAKHYLLSDLLALENVSLWSRAKASAYCTQGL